MSNLNDGGVAWNRVTNFIMEVMQAALPGGRFFLCPIYCTCGGII